MDYCPYVKSGRAGLIVQVINGSTTDANEMRRPTRGIQGERAAASFPDLKKTSEYRGEKFRPPHSLCDPVAMATRLSKLDCLLSPVVHGPPHYGEF